MGIPGPATRRIEGFIADNRIDATFVSGPGLQCPPCLSVSTLEKLEIMDNHRPPRVEGGTWRASQWAGTVVDALRLVKNVVTYPRKEVALCVMRCLTGSSLGWEGRGESLPTRCKIFSYGALRPSRTCSGKPLRGLCLRGNTLVIP